MDSGGGATEHLDPEGVMSIGCQGLKMTLTTRKRLPDFKWITGNYRTPCSVEAQGFSGTLPRGGLL